MSLKKTILTATAAIAVLGGTATAITVMTATPAVAQSSARANLDAAITKGQIGETIAGYLAEVNGQASKDAVAEMNAINIKRKTAFEKKSSETGVSLVKVARLTGEKLLAKADPGTMIMGEDGQWTKK